ncbi:MAG: cell division protein FtsZ [Candidatus Pacebacteria bacterium]|nr:cell division protein FtsZ [Candidatus Paceibacterota bacterium]
MKQIKPEIESFARIKVIGTGGSGCNAVSHMIASKVKGVDFMVVNTDAQDLHHSPAKHKIHIGKTVTRGLGSGMNADIGRQAAEEQIEDIQDALVGANMVFITCGLGGGTGTGSAPIIAKAARESGALTVAIVTLPFGFEGKRRREVADVGLEELRKVVDSIIIIANDKILETVEKNTGLKEAFATCDDVLKHAVEGISDLITKQGVINLDFADICTVMEAAGPALMGIGEASGEARAVEAARQAINSPLLDVSIDGATGVLLSVSGNDDLGIHEIQEAADEITKSADSNATIIFGSVLDETLKKGVVRITVIATGFGNEKNTSKSIFKNVMSVDNAKTIETKEEDIAEQKTENKDSNLEIHNSMPTPMTRPKRSVQDTQNKSSQKVKSKPKKVSIKKDNKLGDDDDFSMIPSFLRRSKLR